MTHIKKDEKWAEQLRQHFSVALFVISMTLLSAGCFLEYFASIQLIPFSSLFFGRILLFLSVNFCAFILYLSFFHIGKCSYQGSLFFEYRNVSILAFSSMISLSAALFLEYQLPYFLSNACLDQIHSGFLINIALGISGSTIVSYFCLLIPFLQNKRSAVEKITPFIQAVFCAYTNLFATILLNQSAEKEQQTDLVPLVDELERNAEQYVHAYAALELSNTKWDHVDYFARKQVLTIRKIFDAFHRVNILLLTPKFFISKRHVEMYSHLIDALNSVVRIEALEHDCNISRFYAIRQPLMESLKDLSEAREKAEDTQKTSAMIQEMLSKMSATINSI